MNQPLKKETKRYACVYNGEYFYEGKSLKQAWEACRDNHDEATESDVEFFELRPLTVEFQVVEVSVPVL